MEFWKICRAINNPIRLALLREIMTSPSGGESVVQAGERLGCKKSLTSQYLKKLAEAGLLSVKRSGRYAVCSSVNLWRSSVSRLQIALAEFFAKRRSDAETEAVLATANALAHHGRIRILRTVAERRGINFADLAKQTGFPFATLRRQLGVLIDADVIAPGEDADGFRTYSLSNQRKKLPFVLVSLALDLRLMP